MHEHIFCIYSFTLIPSLMHVWLILLMLIMPLYRTLMTSDENGSPCMGRYCMLHHPIYDSEGYEVHDQSFRSDHECCEIGSMEHALLNVPYIYIIIIVKDKSIYLRQISAASEWYTLSVTCILCSLMQLLAAHMHAHYRIARNFCGTKNSANSCKNTFCG